MESSLVQLLEPTMHQEYIFAFLFFSFLLILWLFCFSLFLPWPVRRQYLCWENGGACQYFNIWRALVNGVPTTVWSVKLIRHYSQIYIFKKMISVLHRRRHKHCCQHQSKKFRSTKTFHIVQNGLNILTSNHLAKTLYQTYRKKTRRNTLLHTSSDSWPFDPRRPSRIISYRRISGKNVSRSQHFFTWHKISSPCFPNFIWRETWFFCYTLYTFAFLPKLGTQRSEYFWRTKEISLGRSLKILDGAEKAEEWAKLRVVISNRLPENQKKPISPI